jgi:hypothetical protein
MKTVWIYVDTGKDVGDRDHLKIFGSEAAAEAWLGYMTLKASRSNIQ